MLGILSYLFPKRFDWRLIDKNQVSIYIYVHLLSIFSLFHLPDGWIIILIVCHSFVIGFGISIGYHRLLSHRSFSCSKNLKRVFAFLGTLALQGGVISWVSAHRSHHRFTDNKGDPHASSKGFFWSHIWWAVHKGPNGFRYKGFEKISHDLCEDPFMVFLQRHVINISLVLFLLLAVLWGWKEALFVFSVRLVFGWHTTFFVNSLAHSTALAKQGLDSAKNSHWISLLTFGEGYHKNHHDSPGNACFSKNMTQLDAGYLLIMLMSMLGFVKLRGKRQA